MYNSSSTDVCEFSVCQMNGGSFGVEGWFSIQGKLQDSSAKTLHDSVADELEQTRLHDWGLLTLALACFVVAFVAVVVAGFKGKR